VVSFNGSAYICIAANLNAEPDNNIDGELKEFSIVKKHLIECVPNFSEGRRPEVIAEIVAAIGSVAGVTLLDREMDPSHNRCVVTFVAPPGAAVEAALRGMKKAAERIDLNHHQGEHPRMGATDVVPFVPLGTATMDQCVELAKELGRRAGEELGIPVFLYEAAA
jgi:glutamate formiminotransferase